jgi:hypothetical protein
MRGESLIGKRGWAQSKWDCLLHFGTTAGKLVNVLVLKLEVQMRRARNTNSEKKLVREDEDEWVGRD